MTATLRPCSVCPTLVVARDCLERGDFANAGSYLVDAVTLFLDSMADQYGIDPASDDRTELLFDVANIEPAFRKGLFDVLHAGGIAARGDNPNATRPGHETSLRQVLANGIAWLHECAECQPFCTHDYRPGIAPALGRKRGAA